MRSRQFKSNRNKNKGFTLIELAIVLVIIGIIIGAILKGQELINNTKSKRLQSDLKGLESLLWTYYDRKGRWPGDCDIDGYIEYSPNNASSATDSLSSTTDPVAESCGAATPVENQNTSFADLRSSKVATFSTPNATLARNVLNSAFYVGQADDTANSGEKVNVIVAYEVPAWMAKMLDVSLDGIENGTEGRVRRWDSAVVGTSWPTDANSDTLVSVSYMFDRVLP
ncbi:MAG: prepilin-type N-terminal cleavage/methylation domain-containing protein [Gammaproteobacteria bacterium]|nr:prepilin-type N-terminal cleavage/methylation domain-containing protein [Gammaproteobacteria bacterium]MDH5693581.1 prepilin-type N-terminal cleavage/methylation domain-containing protein [Gammaproteobacteria bacterium]